MTIEDMKLEEFQELLEGLINHLKNKGLINPGKDTKELAKAVAEDLNAEGISISGKDLNANPETMKSVGLACIAKSQPELKFDIKILFTPQNELEDADDLKKNLKNIFTEMLKLQPNYKNASEEEKKEMDEKLDEMTEVLTNKFLDTRSEEPVAKNESIFSLVAACLDVLTKTSSNNDQEEMFREQYGVNPIPGGSESTVLAIPAGNQMGVQDLATTGLSFLAQVDNPDPGAPDPLGIKMGAIINRIAKSDISSDFAYELKHEGILDSSPRPSPPGQNHH